MIVKLHSNNKCGFWKNWESSEIQHIIVLTQRDTTVFLKKCFFGWLFQKCSCFLLCWQYRALIRPRSQSSGPTVVLSDKPRNLTLRNVALDTSEACQHRQWGLKPAGDKRKAVTPLKIENKVKNQRPNLEESAREKIATQRPTETEGWEPVWVSHVLERRLGFCFTSVCRLCGLADISYTCKPIYFMFLSTEYCCLLTKKTQFCPQSWILSEQ